MIWQLLSVFQGYPFLPTKIAKDLSDSPSETSLDPFSMIFWQNNNIVLALPFQKCLTACIFNHGHPRPLGPSSGGPFISSRSNGIQRLWIPRRMS